MLGLMLITVDAGLRCRIVESAKAWDPLSATQMGFRTLDLACAEGQRWQRKKQKPILQHPGAQAVHNPLQAKQISRAAAAAEGCVGRTNLAEKDRVLHWEEGPTHGPLPDNP